MHSVDRYLTFTALQVCEVIRSAVQAECVVWGGDIHGNISNELWNIRNQAPIASESPIPPIFHDSRASTATTWQQALRTSAFPFRGTPAWSVSSAIVITYEVHTAVDAGSQEHLPSDIRQRLKEVPPCHVLVQQPYLLRHVTAESNCNELPRAPACWRCHVRLITTIVTS